MLVWKTLVRRRRSPQNRSELELPTQQALAMEFVAQYFAIEELQPAEWPSVEPALV